ncbi:MAG: hypothetical protein ACI3T9_04660 [Romboutsia timonensis]
MIEEIAKQDFSIDKLEADTTRCFKIDYFTARKSDCKQSCMRKCTDGDFDSICDYTKICSKYIGEKIE